MSDFDPNYTYQPTLAIVGQKAIIINSNQEILILKRSEKSGSGGQWSLPGGGLEKGEQSESAILREIQEETGLHPTNLRPFHIKTYFDNDNFIVIIGYTGLVNSKTVQLNWEHTDYQWLTPNKALSLNLTSDARTFIELFEQNTKGD